MYQPSPHHRTDKVFSLSRVIVLLSLSAIFLTGWQLHAAASLATQGEYMWLTQTRVQALKTQNLKLKEEILKRQSFVFLTTQAEKLGFVSTNKFVYLPTSSQAVAALTRQP